MQPRIIFAVAYGRRAAGERIYSAPPSKGKRGTGAHVASVAPLSGRKLNDAVSDWQGACDFFNVT
jgi:hypothetical protein